MRATHTISLIAQSEVIRSIVARIDTIAKSDPSVLLIGETGVGKELFAEYIHHTSPRALRPFIKVGLAALPPDLLESELFGHDKGAYTSASNEKKGLFELAHTGSIFLDDIDDFPIMLQSKLLRVLESHELMRVGGTTPIPIDVRLITASKVDLRSLVEQKLFRPDLFYRINVVPLVIPPLRERPVDIPALVEYFVHRFSPDNGVSVDDDAMKVFVRYSWPGNIRELRNTIQRILLFGNGRIRVEDLPPEIREENPLGMMVKMCDRCFVEGKMTFDEVVACLETNLLRRTMEEAHGNRTHAARKLGMSLSTLRDKLKKYDLDSPPGSVS